MKKILVIFQILICGIIANAQIKVVGDDYSSSLTGAKQFYERDINFERIFPSTSVKDYFGFLTPYFISNDGDGERKIEARINRIGDTVFLTQEIILNSIQSHQYSISGKSTSFGIKTDESGTYGVYAIPSGYYVVSGYTFCSEETKQAEINAGIQREFELCNYFSKDLKEAILLRDADVNIEKYIGYVILTQICEDSNTHPITAYLDMKECFLRYGDAGQGYYAEGALNDKLIYLGFYNEITKTFIGQKVFYLKGFMMIIRTILPLPRVNLNQS